MATLGRTVGSIVILASVHTAAILTVIHNYSSFQRLFVHFFFAWSTIGGAKYGFLI